MSASPPSTGANRQSAAAPRRFAAVDWLLAALLAVLVLLFFARMAFSNLILARGDTFLYFYPYWQMAADALRAGDLPLWNPHIFMGVPFIANSQAGFFYPFNWPMWLLLEVPYAVSASILLHIMIAGLGTFLLGRRVFRLSPVAAFLAAVLFALGGYLTAQVEHINQLQGLAWLPWLFVAAQPVVGDAAAGQPVTAVARRSWLRAGLLVGVIFALQLLAGHTQSTFISGVALALWLLTHLIYGRQNRAYVIQVGALLLLAVAVAVALAAVQLLPTLELTRHSARQGGLTVAEVLSFSWHPLLATRSLLPAYGQSLFSEYVAFLPLTALVLAVVGAWRWRGQPHVVGLLVLVGGGLVLALGRFTPIYWLLANLPGFDLFRVPARWLVLYALGTALLAGRGWDVLASSRPAADRTWLKRPLLAGFAVVLLLIAWGFVAGLLSGLIPTGQEAPFELPSTATVIGWLVELLLLAGLLVVIRRRDARAAFVGLCGLVALAAVVLWLSSRTLPYNNLTTPEAWFDIRPPAARLQALTACEVPGESCAVPPGRLLSLSDIFFDPGDQAEIDTIYQTQLDERARYDYTIAIKQKEIIAPNLPMSYELSSVDGFDGGILPLAAYSELMSLILPQGQTTPDGRLREYLPAIPEARWLDLFNTRYLITDKVGDEWRQGVFFDRQFPTALQPGNAMDVGHVPAFTADSVWLLATGVPPDLVVGSAAGEQWRLTPELHDAPDLYRVQLPERMSPSALTLECAGPMACQLDALTLVDSRDGVFQTVVPGPFRQIYSGDVKIYEVLNVLPRAWLVTDWQWQPDLASSVAAMQTAEFDPRTSAVVVGDPAAMPDGTGASGPGTAASTVAVTAYSAEQVALDITTDRAGLVILSDANYPGWRATLDGEPVPILQTDGLFRGVIVPAGSHRLIYTFSSPPYSIGLAVTLLGILLVVGGLIALVRRGR